jgi:hypothetical protein
MEFSLVCLAIYFFFPFSLDYALDKILYNFYKHISDSVISSLYPILHIVLRIAWLISVSYIILSPRTDLSSQKY